MCKLYKLLLAPMMLYSLSSSYTYAEDVQKFSLKSELLANGNISLSTSINKGSNACIFLSYVQILRNYESSTETDLDGTPMLSRWETVWENTEINQANSLSPKVDIKEARARCKKQTNDVNTRISTVTSLFNAVNKALGNTEKNDDQSAEASLKNWPIILKQGEKYFNFQKLNQSSNYQDAELKISGIYINNLSESVLQNSALSSALKNDSYKISTHVISLKPTIETVTLSTDHKLTYPGFVQGKQVPLAYLTSGENLGCLGKIMPTNDTELSKFDCYYATHESQNANETPQILLTQRSKGDVLIMCPGSTIPDEMSYNTFETNNIEIPTSKGSPYLQVMAETNNKWCQNLEKAERKWTNLYAVSNQGWMISLNTDSNNLECLANNGECVNTLIENSNLNNMIKLPATLITASTLVLTNQSRRSCQYKDGTSGDCPDAFNSSDNISDLLKSIQYESMTRSLN